MVDATDQNDTYEFWNEYRSDRSETKRNDSCLIIGIVLQNEVITTLLGQPIGSKTSLLTVGLHGPAVLQDIQFIEEISHFDRERIPERVVHAKGSGAFGYFRVTNPQIQKYCKAALFKIVGKQTPVAVRFSTVTGEMGSADTVFGQPRGFAVKFYTEEGNWDIVSNNAPVFFIRDPQQFSSLIHANKRNPQTGLPDPNMVWDFFSLRPETLNLITYMYSDYGIPNGFRHMPGFSINAFRLVNNENNAVFAKFHWIPKQGIQNLDLKTATKLRATDPDYSRRDLFEKIDNKWYPSWTLYIQVITQEDVKYFKFNPFDATKFWPKDKYPLIEVGVMTLDRNPSNFFAEVEQLAFDPANLVNGVEPSPDELLLGRLFSYKDTQNYRLGTNNHLIPVNKPINHVLTPTQRDGSMRVDGNFGSLADYYPNSYSSFKDNPKFLESKFTVKTSEVFRYETKDDENYKQTKEMYYSLPESYRKNLHKNIAIAMKGVHEFIKKRMVEHFFKVDPNYGKAVSFELSKIN